MQVQLLLNDGFQMRRLIFRQKNISLTSSWANVVIVEPLVNVTLILRPLFPSQLARRGRAPHQVILQQENDWYAS